MATPLALLGLALAIYAIADREIEKRAEAKRTAIMVKSLFDTSLMLRWRG